MNLPELILFTSKQNSSESVLHFKLSKMIGNKPDRKQDDHSLRKLREGDLSEKHFKKLFGDKIDFSLVEEYISYIDPNTIGGWLYLESLIKNLRARDKEEQVYFDFLLTHCEMDRSYLSYAKEKDPGNKNDLIEINEEIKKWLVLTSFDLNNMSIKKSAELIISLILYWAALFEFFLKLEYKEDAPKIKNYLPSINNKGKFIPSNEVFLVRYKRKWAEYKYSKNDITWVKLFRDIKKAQSTDSLENQINPYIDDIKQTFKEWRTGKRFLSIDAAKKELFVLFQDYDPKYLDYLLPTIVFIQLFDNIQREVLKEGLPEEFVVAQFAKYPIHQKLVKQRFDKFKDTRVLMP